MQHKRLTLSFNFKTVEGVYRVDQFEVDITVGTIVEEVVDEYAVVEQIIEVITGLYH